MKMDYVKQGEPTELNHKTGRAFRGRTANLTSHQLRKLIETKENASKLRLWRLTRYIIEISLILSAFIYAYITRFYLQVGSEVLLEYQNSLWDYMGISVSFSIILFAALQIKGFYRLPRTANFLDELGLIISSTFISISIVLLWVFVTRSLEVSRLMFVYVVPLTIFFLAVERLMMRQMYRAWWKRGIGVSNSLVVGATDVGMRLMRSIVERPTSGYRLMGYVDNEERFSKWTLPTRYLKGTPTENHIELLGEIDQLQELIKNNNIKQVFIALPSSQHETIDRVIRQCHDLGVDFILAPDIFELKINSLSVQELNGIPLISYRENALTGWNYIIKRAVDLFLAAIAITIAIIPMTLVAIAIKLDSKGPIFFRQTRVGKGGKFFTCLKFRSMYVNAEEMQEKLAQFNQTGGATFKMNNDPRRTRVGRFIRRTSLDELPQFFNILVGEMSFVGPRPPMVTEVAKYDDWHHRRLEVTPGLSGMWQVSGRSNISFEDMVKLDIYYAEHWSLWLDLKIMVQTPFAVIRGDGAF
jgi:exopolysaccharide biosynthesis polyprenyl glycosylphosphotransferase